MFTSAFVAITLAASALANIFVTQPVSSTTCSGGQTCNVAWQDDGTSPALSSFGNSMVSLYVGNQQQQTMVQSITTSVNVATTSAIQFTVDPNAGSNGNFYFIRFQSLGLMDATNPQFPALAFSAKFTLNNMSGSFNASVQSEIDGASTAPLATPSAASSASGSQTSGITTTKASSTGSATGTSSAKPTTTSSAADRNMAITSVFGAGAMAAIFALVL